MRWSRWVVSVLTVIAVSLAVFVGWSSAHPSAGTIKVGLIVKTTSNPYFADMIKGAQAQANKLHVKLLVASGKFDGDTASQITAIENMVSAGVKGIMITASGDAVVPALKKARAAGVYTIALDSPTNPPSAVDALFATNNYNAGKLIGEYAKKSFASKPAHIVMIDLFPGPAVGVLRHNGFLAGFGVGAVKPTDTVQKSAPQVECAADGYGDQAKGQSAMENCLSKAPDVNLVYTINEPDAAGAYTALKNAGKSATIVSIDGGCQGVRNVKAGIIAATSQQYPHRMASLGLTAIVKYAKTGKKATGYTDTGVNLITAKPVPGVPSKSVSFGLANCWGS